MMERPGKLPAANNWKEIYLTVILCFLSILFSVSLFKNISYPLFWADESMTVMHGKRVLEYGYPKVHDGKNVLYDLRHPNLTLGIDEKTDAFIGGANWGMYYFAAIGIKLAELSSDIFTKTAIIRITFAFIGLTGLVIFAFLASQFFGSGCSKIGFLNLFVFLELISMPLALHLREARYYPLTVFLVALTVFSYTQYRILDKTKYSSFLALLTVSLVLLFFTFSPAYFILLAAIFLFESLTLAKRLFFQRQGTHGKTTPRSYTPKELIRDYLNGMFPLIVSLIAISPIMIYFRMSYIAGEIAKFNNLLSNTDSTHMYLDNLSIIWRFFASSDFIYLAILLKFCVVFVFLKSSGKDIPSSDVLKIRFSNLLTVIFIIYFCAIAKVPNFAYTRYFIPIQPVLALIVIFDLAIIYNFLSRYRSFAVSGGFLVVLFIGFVFFNISKNAEFIEGHLYELSHQYKGPLDYVIPFIQKKFTDTGRLIIATNYEETSFMYYLKAKVIVGFVGNSLQEDSRAIPDIIVYRKAGGNFKELFSAFLKKSQYSIASFPVVDHLRNNVPELNWAPPYIHLFRTEDTDDEREMVDILLRM